MREASTVAFDPARNEFQFICDDPGPVLLLPADGVTLAQRQRDGTYLLRGFTDPDYTIECEFTLRAPLMRLTNSLRPAPPAPRQPSREAVDDAPEAQPTLVGWQPAPPAPPDPRKVSLSFFRPRQSVAEQISEKPFQPQPVEESKPLETTMDPVYTGPRVDTGAMTQNTDWQVHYVMSDPDVPDEQERVIHVVADSDAGALREAHARLRDPAREVSYRVIAVNQAEATEFAS